MSSSEVQIDVGELDGCRLIRSTFSGRIDSRTLSVPAARFLALWDETTPTVLLTEVSGIEHVDSQSLEVLVHIIRRDETRPNLVATSFVTGGNEYMAKILQTLLPTAGRSVETIFEDDEAAVAYLREQIRSHRSDTSEEPEG